MQAPAVPTVFDVVYWFTNQALDDREYLQPAKLQRLLYLAQAYFGVLHRGRMLMPAIFVAHESGPIEPNVFRLYEGEQRPYVEARLLPEDVEEFLTQLWRRFGAHSAEYLTRIVKNHKPYQETWREQPGGQITLEAMIGYYGKKRTEVQARATGALNADQVVRPKAMRTQSGRMVSVQAWNPRRVG